MFFYEGIIDIKRIIVNMYVHTCMIGNLIFEKGKQVIFSMNLLMVLLQPCYRRKWKCSILNHTKSLLEIIIITIKLKDIKLKEMLITFNRVEQCSVFFSWNAATVCHTISTCFWRVHKSNMENTPSAKITRSFGLITHFLHGQRRIIIYSTLKLLRAT